MPVGAGVQVEGDFELATATEREAQELSKQLAMALGSPWRGRIWLEISLRPMSPSQFVREIGGNPRHIRRCFRQLEEWGFIEVAETRHEGNRRGRPDHVYRSIRRALIDTPISEHLPLSVREDISVNALTNYFRRLALAIESGSFDDGANLHLSSDPRELDRAGWERLMTSLDECLDWLPNLVLEASERMSVSGDAPIPTTVALLAFRSPSIASGTGKLPALPDDSGRSRPLANVPPAPFLTLEVVKALRNPLGPQILAETSERAVSPSSFASKYGGELSHIGRCFRQLADAGCIELVREQPGGRGAGPAGIEHFYRSVRRGPLPAKICTIPAMLDDAAVADEMNNYIRSVMEAMAAGTFDADADRYMAWDVIALDPLGWKELMARLRGLRQLLTRLGAEAKAPDEMTGAQPELIPTTVGLAAFRSPPPWGPSEAGGGL
jgi:hypothetical protein